MQIHNEHIISQRSAGEQPLQLRDGEHLHAIVKERLDDSEVILRLKGRDVRVRFADDPPVADKLHITVLAAGKEPPLVKKMEPMAQKTAPSPKSSGLPDIPHEVKGHLRKAVEILTSRGLPVSKADIQELVSFFQKEAGTTEAKLETIAAMAKKGLEFTATQLNAVHTALHDKSLKNAIAELAGEKSQLQVLPGTGSVLMSAWEGVTDPSPGSSTSLFDELIKALRKEPDLGKIFTMLQRELDGAKLLNDSQSEKIQEVLSKAQALSESGRELAARQFLISTLEQVKLDGASASEPAPVSAAYALTDEFISVLPHNSKDFIVTTVSEKLAQLTIDFKQMKQEMMRNLRTVQFLIGQNRAQADSVLSATIKQLDQAILRSDVMLYTDMATEKTLLEASSRLAEAKKLLAAGETAAAKRIVAEVQKAVEKIIFKPSDMKVRHFVSEKLLNLEAAEPRSQAAMLAGTALREPADLSSGRAVFEALRRLGLTYEGERALALVTNGNAQTEVSSLKDALLKLARASEDQALMQKAEQMITNLTGQQLLSKNDSASLQSMMFILPFLLRDKAEQVKVFINSKNKQEKVDWENCRLYFLIETARLGEVGISLTVVERNLSVTIKNDKPGFEEKVAPLTGRVRERLEDIGYSVNSIRFGKFSEEEKAERREVSAQKRTLSNFTGRGYDFTV